VEIEIPDLDDLEFVRNCLCSGHGLSKKPKSDCYRCGGVGRYLTPVGSRLIDFLESLGLSINKEGWFTNTKE